MTLALLLYILEINFSAYKNEELKRIIWNQCRLDQGKLPHVSLTLKS